MNGHMAKVFGGRLAVAGLMACSVLGVLGNQTAKAEADPFTVAKYPVDAVADNAAEAQKQALADGRRSAIHSLFRRLVPVSAYSQLPKLRKIDPTRLISRVAVRSAENSSTQYIASLDFSFDPKGIKEALRQQGVPYVEEQAEPTLLVPVVVVTDGAAKDGIRFATGQEAQSWGSVWRGLDLTNSLAPLQVVAARPGVDAAAVKAARSGDASLLTVLATRYQASQVVLAVSEFDARSGKLKVTIAGQDSAGPFALNRVYPARPGEIEYAMEMAAVIGLGMFEGRWKATQGALGSGNLSEMGPPVPVQLFVEFNSMSQWRKVREQLAKAPGVEDLQIGGLSARGADVALRFPGGGQGLASILANRGISLREDGGIWVARGSY